MNLAQKLWCAAGIVVLTSILIGAHAQPARAGTYAMWNCSVPGRSNALLAPWQPLDTMGPNLSIADDCASGGGVGVVVGDRRQMVGGTAGGLVLFKPSGQRSRITFVKLVLWYATRLSGWGQPINFWSADWRSDGVYRWGLSNAPPGSESVVAEHQLFPDTAAVRLGIHCGPLGPPTPPDVCVATESVPALIRGIEVTLSEDVPPGVARPSGELLEDGPQSGIRTLTYAASDPQSGVRQVDVLLGETVVATRELSSACSYSDFTVCPAAVDGAFRVDTRAASNGSHRLTVRVQDAAGNVQEVHGTREVKVANAANASATPQVTDPSRYKLSAQFRESSRSTLTVPYGRPALIRGRLARTSGTVAPGTRIEVLERRDQRGAREVSRATVKTKADGSFSVVLNATRPSRMVRLVYRPTAGSQVLSQALKLRVRAASRVRASLRGSVLRFSGRVLSTPVPKAGKRIVMEGRSPGSAWTPFKNLRTDRQGRFSGTYRLRVRRPGVRLKVRAVVPSEAGYGYVGSRSRATTLRVR